MRFRLSTLLLATALTCALVGWIVDRRVYTTSQSEATKRESLITSAVSIAMTTNRLFENADTLDSTEFASIRRQQLFANVVFLYRHEPYFVDRTFVQTELLGLRLAHEISVLDESGKSLRLLGIETPEQFFSDIEESGLSRIWIDALLKNDNDEIHEDLPEFITRSIKMHNERDNYDLDWRFPGGKF